MLFKHGAPEMRCMFFSVVPFQTPGLHIAAWITSRNHKPDQITPLLTSMLKCQVLTRPAQTPLCCCSVSLCDSILHSTLQPLFSRGLYPPSLTHAALSALTHSLFLFSRAHPFPLPNSDSSVLDSHLSPIPIGLGQGPAGHILIPALTTLHCV